MRFDRLGSAWCFGTGERRSTRFSPPIRPGHRVEGLCSCLRVRPGVSRFSEQFFQVASIIFKCSNSFTQPERWPTSPSAAAPRGHASHLTSRLTSRLPSRQHWCPARHQGGSSSVRDGAAGSGEGRTRHRAGSDGVSCARGVRQQVSGSAGGLSDRLVGGMKHG
jgi:hypothetical protein